MRGGAPFKEARGSKASTLSAKIAVTSWGPGGNWGLNELAADPTSRRLIAHCRAVRPTEGTPLVKLGLVALDGTKLRVSASRRKAISYGRLGPKVEQLEAEVAAILAEAEAEAILDVPESYTGKFLREVLRP